MSSESQDLITEKEAAVILKMSARTLQRWRRIRKGPSFVKLGGYAVRYRRGEVESYVDREAEKARQAKERQAHSGQTPAAAPP